LALQAVDSLALRKHDIAQLVRLSLKVHEEQLQVGKALID
jgi:hypothetical protein